MAQLQKAMKARFNGCWRVVCKEKVVVDVNLCYKCPMRGNGCRHKCSGYKYGVIRMTFKEDND